MQTSQIQITKLDHDTLLKLIDEQERVNSKRDETLVALRQELGRAQLKNTEDIEGDVITLNSVVQLRDLDFDEVEEYKLVFPQDADIESGKISILAPLGTAMLGYRVNDEFEWKMPAGVRHFRVEAVLFQPEAEAVEE